MPMLQDLPPMMNMGCVPQDIDGDVFSELARMGADDCVVAADNPHLKGDWLLPINNKDGYLMTAFSGDHGLHLL